MTRRTRLCIIAAVRDAIGNAARTLMVGMALIGFVIVAPSVEEKVFPVFDRLEVVDIEREAGVIRFALLAHKRRDCTIGSLMWWVEQDGARRGIDLRRWTGDPVQPRPVLSGGEVARLGPWSARLPQDVDLSRPYILSATAAYLCHPLWTATPPWPAVVIAP